MKKILASLVFACVFSSVLFAQRVVYEDDKGGTLEVVNDFDENIVLFVGAVSKKNFLGGVEAGNSRSIDIRKKLSRDKGIVLILAIKEETFKKKKYKIQDEDILFSNIVIYDKELS